MRNIKRPCIIGIFLLCIFQSCYKKEIDFGTVPANNYTKLVYTDTIGVQLSTLVIDSFATNSATSMLLGKYRDPYLGVVSCQPFFQLGTPGTSTDIPSTAIFDSLIFIIPLNHYYYGDTSKAQTISVYELAQQITYTYGEEIYNTTNVAVKPVPLGSRTVKFSPSGTDSLIIRLDQIRGLDLFTKLQQKYGELNSDERFLNYFNGITLAVGQNDTTAVYGVTGASSMMMRVKYHHTTPNYEEKSISFPLLANTYAFNQILANRAGTGLQGGSSIQEFSSQLTGNRSYSQYGTGLLLKMTFPTLRSILKTDNIVQLAKAELVLRPTPFSFDRYKYKLPESLYMLQTDGSNIASGSVLDSSLTSIQYSSPVVDEIYGENNYYRFDITPYIRNMLATAGSEDDGFFLVQAASSTDMQVNRLVINDNYVSGYKPQLLLSLLVINK